MPAMGAWFASCSTYVDNSSQCIYSKDASGIIVLWAKHYCPSSAYCTSPTSIIIHPTPCRAFFLSFSSSSPPFPCMPDIIPSSPTAQPATASLINAQFLNAVTRGDENYARSLLARGADVNASDAVGRSTVACVVAGERYVEERAGCSRDWAECGPPAVGRPSILRL